MIRIHLPGIPIGKGRIRFARNGHAYTPQRTRTYEAALRIAAGEAMAGRPPLDGPVAVEITAVFPIPQSWSKRRKARAAAGLEYATGKPDADNLLKACDALNEIAFRDDRQIVRAIVAKHYGIAAELVITIIPITDASCTHGAIAAPAQPERSKHD